MSVVKISKLYDTHVSCASIGGSFTCFSVISQCFQCSDDTEVALLRLERTLVPLHHRRFVIATDVKAKSPMRGGTKTDVNDEKLLEFIAQYDMVILKDAGSIPKYTSPT